MKRLLLAILLFALAPFAAPALLAQAGAVTHGMGPVDTLENGMWESLQAQNYDAITANMAPNFVYIGPEGITDRQASMTGMKTCKLNSYTLHDPQSRMLSPDMVLVTYSATVDSTCGQEPVKGEMNCSSLWSHSGGKWMAVSHTETVAQKPHA